jgi:hypothetical protein
MLGRRQRPAQDFIENPLSHPQRQSREAGSCMGALRSLTGLSILGLAPAATPTLATGSL